MYCSSSICSPFPERLVSHHQGHHYRMQSDCLSPSISSPVILFLMTHWRLSDHVPLGLKAHWHLLSPFYSQKMPSLGWGELSRSFHTPLANGVPLPQSGACASSLVIHLPSPPITEVFSSHGLVVILSRSPYQKWPLWGPGSMA